MTIYASLLTAALLAVGSVRAETTCTKYESGVLITGPFYDKTGTKQVGLKPYAFNSRQELAYYKSGNHPNITVEFQWCDPAYSETGTRFLNAYGRFYIPALDKCLAVTNPSGAPPYIVAAKPCIPAKDMNTTASIPFNFYTPVSEGGDDWNNYFWTGASKPEKHIYQGVGSDAERCYGSYFVNATNLQHGHNYGDDGEPSVSSSSQELNRIHLYCPKHNSAGGIAESVTNFRMSR
ncbi:hypothetical protein FRC12_012120 [Ceratobasidium sp. 428]|nr:hypothetical protein FRC12_012120 [Ceratobasidium sp. 428]